MARRYRHHRSINFDYKTQMLKLQFGENNTSKAYRLTREFMENNGFKHRQYSGYMSNIPMSNSEVLDFVEKMYQELPWLERCAERIDVAIIGTTFDAIEMHNQDKTRVNDIQARNFTKRKDIGER
jgi:virulence-associated protein VapD